jgi:hypothetical protein
LLTNDAGVGTVLAVLGLLGAMVENAGGDDNGEHLALQC